MNFQMVLMFSPQTESALLFGRHLSQQVHPQSLMKTLALSSFYGTVLSLSFSVSGK